MDTRQFVEYAVLCLLWSMVLWRAPAARRIPRQRALWVTFAALTLAMTLRLPAVMDVVDGGTGVNNLSTLFKHFLGITAAAALLEFVHSITRPDSADGRRRRLVATLVALVALTLFFFLMPRESQAEDFFEANVGSGAATAYLMVWFGCLGTAMATATALFWGAGRQAAAGWLRTGLRLLGLGCAAGVLYSLLRAGYLLVRLVGTADAGTDAQVAEVTDLLKHAAIVLILLGTSIPAAGVAWRGWQQWRHLRRLRPLWAELTAAVPEVVLDEGLRRHELRLRLHRRVVEIRDALLALQPYIDPDRRAAAREAAADAETEESERRILADACWVEVARHAKLAGREPGSAPAREPDDGATPVWGSLDDLESEARLLIRLEHARHRATVREFVREHTDQEATQP
ncbi:hypothetical protein MTQ01_05995 [Streptomyces sp. XM4193]|uniref:MAB_1171c family putative transporter n=1 Tax=Streptomyces sp. XM4193 TaxID=2929782 RepID=UPI001FF7F2F2|nr:MAB_1171c family putative transporter [Streptomyces sp. XM4193]MCK1795566.1 hypothetical protein [Streptomyces sp. XM4193]